MRPETIEALTVRARQCLQNCLAEDGGDADVYVSCKEVFDERAVLILVIGAFALFCSGWSESASVCSQWHEFTI